MVTQPRRGLAHRNGTAHGGAYSRSGEITRTAPGQYDYQRSFTGPNGQTYTRSGQIDVTR